MIKIFRNARKKMLAEGRVRKYMTYAFGEILLVVIGILIALSINNWNNNRLLRQTEQNVLDNIQSQINEDAQLLHGVVDYNQAHMARYIAARRIIETNNRNEMDTLAKIIPTILRYFDFNRSGNFFQNLMSSGDLKLIKNPSIIRRIQILEEQYIYLNRWEENHFKAILEIGSEVLQNLNLSTGKIERPEAIYRFQTQNLFYVFIDISNEKDEIYHRALEEIEAINELI